LSGGEDVDPARYGEAPSPALGSVNRRRDQVEFTALEYALQQQMPVLGICRGVQVINVALGGTLYQDLATECPGPVLHQQREDWGHRTHRASVVEGSRLHEIVRSDELLINSYHHQAIRDVAPGLKVVARAEDGMVEAVEGQDHRWLIGVQWHPERYEASTSDNDPDRLLFRAFSAVLYGAATRLQAAADAAGGFWPGPASWLKAWAADPPREPTRGPAHRLHGAARAVPRSRNDSRPRHRDARARLALAYPSRARHRCGTDDGRLRLRARRCRWRDALARAGRRRVRCRRCACPDRPRSS